MRDATDHHPSRWSKRVAVALAAAVGAVISLRLAAYQFGWTSAPWEPLFGDGAVRVLRSSFSRALPIPDAALGAVAYVAEVVTVLWGGSERYRTEPLRVYAYGLIALGMALGSAALVVLQLAVIHALCTLCLVSAALSVSLIAPAWFEVVATWRARAAPDTTRHDRSASRQARTAHSERY